MIKRCLLALVLACSNFQFEFGEMKHNKWATAHTSPETTKGSKSKVGKESLFLGYVDASTIRWYCEAYNVRTRKEGCDWVERS